jgi:hypothetical protein
MSLSDKTLAQNSQELTARLAEIERLCTPAAVGRMLNDSLEKVLPLLLVPTNRHLLIVFASTAALLRNLKGGTADAPIAVLAETIEKGRSDCPQSQVLLACDPQKQLVITVGTSLPLSLVLGSPGDAIFTHTRSCMLLPPHLQQASSSLA